MRSASTIRDVAVRVWVAVAALAVLSCVPPNAEPSPDLSTLDGTARTVPDTISTTMDRYQALLATASPAEARATLIQELATTEGVVSATLSTDGYTIRIEYADGSTAAINTNEFGLEPLDEQELSTLLDPLAKSGVSWRAQSDSVSTQARVLTGGWCFGIAGHEHRKVKIVITASVGNPSLITAGNRLHDGFIARGWADEEVDLLYRDGRFDTSVLPDDLLNNADYGVVIILANASVIQSKDGQDHFILQCCSAEADYSYLDDVNPELRPKYARWTADGKIQKTWTWSATGEKLSEYWLRDDLFASELAIDPNAIVHIMSPNGWVLQDEFTITHAVGSFMSWDGELKVSDGTATVLGMFSAMGGETPKTDEQAIDTLRANKLALSTGPNGEAVFGLLAIISDDAYLPAWGRVSVPSGGVPEGTVSVNVKMTFPDACTDASNEFAMDPAETIDFDYLTPGRAVIAIEALDGSGNVLGTGQTEMIVKAGLNQIQVKTCTGLIALIADEYPTDGPNTVTAIHAEFTRPNSDLPVPPALDFVPDDYFDSPDIWTGPVTVTTTATNTVGTVLATSTHTVDVVCDWIPLHIRYGWAKLVARKYPFNATKIRVTSFTGGNGPWPITLVPGEFRNVYGYALDQTAIFDAEALDSFDHVVGHTQVFATIASGENEVPIDIVSYGIILTASSNRVLADGVDFATVTATLKAWKEGDVLEPTGDPMPGKSVKFDTDIGTLTGTNPAVTDANGQATVQLSSTQVGTTRLHAFVEADTVENTRILEVTFGGEYGIILTGPQNQVPPDGANHSVTATLRRFKDSDTTVPTGDPLVGKQVTFSTNLGSLTGPNPVTTNAQGQATIQISSTVQGTATVTAAVVADGVEASCAVAFETWVIAQMEQVGPEIRPVKQPPWPAWPANVMFSEVAYAPLVAGAHTYELEVYNKDPQQGGQRVGQPIHLSSQGAYPDPDNPTRFYYVVYQTSDWVADAGSAATVIAALHEQYDTYWVRVRVLN